MVGKPKRPAAQKQALNIRLERHYINLIDARAQKLGASRSAVVRMLLKQALGTPAIEAATQEAWYEIQPVFRIAMRKASALLYNSLEKDLRPIIESVVNRELSSNDRGAA